MNAPPQIPTSTNISPPQSVQSFGNSISQTINNLSQSVKSNMSSFSQPVQAGVDAPSGFLQSNSIIAKFAFLILVIVIFLFLLNLGVLIMQNLMFPTSSPYLVDGLIDGTNGLTITQDPKNDKSILIRRSNNQTSGIEFTWSTWIRIDELPDKTNGKYQHIFHKGSNEFDEVTGVAKINNGPGLYVKQLAPTNNANVASIKVIMSTTKNGNNDFIEVDDIPLKQWVNIIIRMQNTVLDVYVNGTVAGRLNLTEVPLQNYYDVNICKNGGFNGKVSNLRYFDHALNIFQITKIVAAGPNLKSAVTSAPITNFNYISTSWYTAKL